VTENQAYVLVIALGVLAFCAVCIGLRLLGARDDVVAMSGLFVAMGASFIVGMVGVHYERHRRTGKRRR
jgi:hypothetical protein